MVAPNAPADPVRRVGSALAVPAYRWYWASQLVSGVGTWSQVVAQSWLVLQLTSSPLALGTVTTLQFLPMLVFPLLGGVVADRVSRRRLLLATQVGALAQAIVLGLLVATGTVQYWEIAVLALLLGLTNAFAGPAQQALVPELVGWELVGNAVALNSIQFNLARLVGSAVGGLLVAALGIAAALVLNAASFVPVIVVLAVIRPAHAAARRAGPATAVASDIRAALRYAAVTPEVRRVLALFGVVGLFGFNWAVAVPLLAVSLGAGSAGLGALMSALGAGSLAAGILLTRTRGATEGRLLLGGLAMGGIIVLLGLSSWYAVSIVLMVVAGLAGIVASVSANTLLQLRTPDELRGRVMSLYVMLIGGTTPIGALLLGGIAETLGIRDGLVVFGALTIVGLLAVVALDRAGGRAPAAPVTPYT